MAANQKKKRSSTHEPILRLVAALLDGREYTIASAASTAGVKSAAAKRYLDLSEKCIPGIQLIREVPLTWRYFRQVEQQPKPLVLGALAVVHSLLASLRGSVLDQVLKEFISDVTCQIADPRYLNVDISRMFYAHARTVRIRNLDHSIVDRIVQAVLETQLVVASYRDFSGNVEQVRIAPYTLITWEEGLYCLGRCISSSISENVGRTKHYNISRLAAVALTGERFLYPAADEYDPRRLMRHCMGIFLPRPGEEEPESPVVVEFGARWGSYVKEHDFHESQQLLQSDDPAWTRISISVHVNYDMVRWIRGFGNEARVVSPSRLRDWIQSGEGAEYAMR